MPESGVTDPDITLAAAQTAPRPANDAWDAPGGVVDPGRAEGHMIPPEPRPLQTALRKGKVIPLDEAGKIIAAKTTVLIAGPQSTDAAMSLVRAALRAGATGMTLIPPSAGSIAADLWIAAGALQKLYLACAGFEFLDFAPSFRKAVTEGDAGLEVVEIDESVIRLGCEAAARGRPFNVVRHLSGDAAHGRLGKEVKTVVDPFTGKTVYAIAALRSDVALIHAQAADILGNAQCWDGNRHGPDTYKAAGMVIVQADTIVSADEIGKDAAKATVPGSCVDYVVHAPFGAHPTSSSGRYGSDEEHLRLYLEMCRDGREQEYLHKYVYGPKDHREYLKLVGGTNRMSALRAMLAR